jgi:pimeloyl-ACP methyl ester carboxylesterase
MQEVQLDQGTIRYSDSGTGEPIVFLHGALVNGQLWRKLVAELQPDFRCIVPELPLGSHTVPMKPDADFSLPGLATLVADFMAALDLSGVTLVGNDTGGAIAQRVATDHPDRLARLVLTACDAYEHFFPPLFRYLQLVARLPGAASVLGQTMRLRPLQRAPIAYGWLVKRQDDEVVRRWVEPIRRDKGVRRDALKLLRSIDKRYTLEAAEKLRGFDRPALVIWSEDERVFPKEDAGKLAAALPNARLEWVSDSYTFISEDQPHRLAELIAGFIREHTTAPPVSA